MSEQEYRELHPGEIIQPGDEFCVSVGQDRWQPYPTRRDGSLVSASSLARRPISKTNQAAFEEVPGSRTSQQAIDQPQRERIAYEDLQPGDIIQEGDEWQNESGRWQPFASLDGSCVQVRHTQRARRPYNIAQVQSERDEARKAVTQMMVQLTNQAEVLAEVRADKKRLFDDLELLRSEYAKLQNERDELKAALRECGAAHKVTMEQGLAVCKERNEANAEIQKLLQTITDNADQFANAGRILEQERDEARAERDRLQEVVGNLYNEPTARQVQDMLRTWATELDWSADCFDSVGREQIDGVQKTLIAVMERIEGMIHPEGGGDE